MKPLNSLKTLTVSTVLAGVTLVSCDFAAPDIHYSQFRTIPKTGWLRDCWVEFDPFEADTLPETQNIPCDVICGIRHSRDFKYKSIWVEVETCRDYEVFSRDTVAIDLVDENGEWLGKGVHNIFTLTSPLVKGVKSMPGYRISISPVMNTDTLKGVYNIGLILQKSK